MTPKRPEKPKDRRSGSRGRVSVEAAGSESRATGKGPRGGLDAVDGRLLRALQEDARVTNARLAELAGISPAATHQRVRKLRSRGYIRGYATILDAGALGLDATVLVSVTLRKHGTEALERFKATVSSFDRVRACWHMAGEADFVLKVVARDIADYERFVREELSAVENVGRIRSSFCLSTVKDEPGLPLGISGVFAGF